MQNQGGFIPQNQQQNNNRQGGYNNFQGQGHYNQGGNKWIKKQHQQPPVQTGVTATGFTGAGAAPVAPPKINFADIAKSVQKRGLGMKKIDPLKEHVKLKLKPYEIDDEVEVQKVKDIIDKLKQSIAASTSGDTTKTPDAAKADKSKETKENEENKENTSENEPKEKIRPRRKGALSVILLNRVKEL